ncbi:phage antirepressor KilAC domain-containing protein [Vagococcus carniphilus]|uniref:phage antirepressor n=1 Tax=Vagococcus carniphilus TaxID=218144 RepID=UPI0028905CE6|nr:phage antirepressor KilAC domain-containing protein [Vagococcus carniphilus]MDT2813785.1 phage antirepressor KilAC domain-containing protein [Vagococcus carniphilus]
MNLQIIEQREVLNKDFKIYGDLDNPLFLAKDVAEWIEHSQPSVMLKKIDNEEKVMNNVHTLGGNQEAWFLTEDGLYEVLMQSRKPIAKKFKKEVKQILKDIRKHGMYAKEELLDNPDLLLDVVSKLKEERTGRLVAEQRVNELQPKADYYDNILNNQGLVTISKISKNYGMSAVKFNQLLHDLGVQFNQSGTWLLYSKHQSKGYTHIEPFDYPDKNGVMQVKTRMKWTQKGHIFIYELLKKNGILPMIEINDIA